MDDEVRFLEEIVSIPSTTGNTNEILKRLIDLCLEMGLRAQDHNGILVINPEGKDILLLGHMDTVPGTIPAKIENGELWGRGAVDAKGPLCAAIMAISRSEYKDRICLVAVPDEEGGSSTAKEIANKWVARPTIILEPSGYDGITIQYNGRLLLDITSKAPRSHSGADIPFATENVVRAYNKIQRITDPRILEFRGGIEEASMRLDIRYTEEPSIEELDNVDIEIIEDVKMYRSEKRSQLVRAFLRSMRSEGIRPIFKRKTGTCDFNIIGNAWGAPIVAYGPGDGKLDHSPEERIQIDEYLASISVLEEVLKNFLIVD